MQAKNNTKLVKIEVVPVKNGYMIHAHYDVAGAVVTEDQVAESQASVQRQTAQILKIHGPV